MIETSHAQIHTTTVELKIITVNNRQMTLSVFRQIPEKRIIDFETLQLRGTPWGCVNYFWPDIQFPGCRTTPKRKTQVVWQSGDVLYRSVVYHLPFKSLFPPSWEKDKENYDNQASAVFNLQNTLRHNQDSKILQDKLAAMKPAFQKLSSKLDDWTQRHNKLIDELMSLDQLFIAVGGGGKRN